MSSADSSKEAAAAGTAADTPSTDGAAAAAVVMPVRLKKRRQRATKTSSTAHEDEEEATAAEGEAGGAAAAADSLHTIKLMQKLRSKGATALALGESDLHLPEAAAASAAESAAAASSSSAAASAAAPGGSALIGKEFGAEGKDAQAALIEEQMEKYIAEQLAARRAIRQPQKKEQAPSAPVLNLSEDQLFVTPAHLKIRPSVQEEGEEESGERWLTGIAECSVSIKDKMSNIEKTEQAKAKMMAEMSSRRDVSMVLPANFNSNFKLHKKEWDSKRRDEFRAFHDAQNRQQALAQGLPAPAPSQPWARDVPLSASDPRALPGFLAGPDEPRRDFAARGGGGGAGGAGGQRGSGVPNATDDRVVDRFIKRFKYK